MPKTPGKMHMYDMVKIDTIVFEIIGGGGLLKPPPPPPDCSLSEIARSLSCPKKIRQITVTSVRRRSSWNSVLVCLRETVGKATGG